jgi:anti-anti-sigma regulatory factor
MTTDHPQPALRGDIRLARIGDAHAALQALVASGAPTLDLSEVTGGDVSLVQLVLSADRTARRDGRTLSLTGVSAALRLTFSRAGVGYDAATGRLSSL